MSGVMLLQDRLKWLQAEESRFIDDTSGAANLFGLVRWSAEKSANANRDSFHQSLKQAKEALDRSDAPQAKRFLDDANRYWKIYIQKNEGGAKKTTYGLADKSSNILIGAGLAAPFAASGPPGWIAVACFSVAAHVGVFKYLVSNENEAVEEKSTIPNPADPGPTLAEKKKDEQNIKPTQCESSAGGSSEAADVTDALCTGEAVPNIDQEILNAVRPLKKNEDEEAVTVKQMIVEGTAVLEDFKHGRPTDDFDFGRFSLRSEAATSPHVSDQKEVGALLKAWTPMKALFQAHQNEEDYLDALNPSRSFERLRDEAIDQGLSFYDPDLANLSDFARHLGINCEGQGKLFTSLYYANHPALGENEIFGIQIYGNHERPVIYNNKSGELWDLVYNTRTFDVVADIYHPLILVHGFLVGQGREPPVSTDDLLLVKAKTSHLTTINSNNSSPTNSTLNLPPSNVLFGDGTPPKAQVLDLSPTLNISTPANDIPGLNYMTPADKKQWAADLEALGVKDKSVLVTLSRLSNAAQRYHFLLQIAVRQLSSLLQTSKYQAYFNIMDDPRAVLVESKKDWPSYRFPTFSMEQQLHLFKTWMVKELAREGLSKTEQQVETEILNSALMVADYYSRRRDLNKRIAQNPQAFIRFMDALPQLDKEFFIQFLLDDQKDLTDLQPLFDWLKDPTRIAISDPPGRAGFIQIELIAVDDINSLLKVAPKSQSAINGKKEGTKPTIVQHFISPRTFIHLVLKMSEASPELLKRWTPEISAIFESLNIFGIYDDPFLKIAPTIKKYRDEAGLPKSDIEAIEIKSKVRHRFQCLSPISE